MDRTGNPAPPSVTEALKAPGRPLEPPVRQQLDHRFGHDFSGVRIHTDSQAAESARSVNALAYTVGRDVFFDTGRYAPSSDDGMQLLVHELTHVVQQSSPTPYDSGSVPMLAPDSAQESQARGQTAQAAPAPVATGGPVGVARQVAEPAVEGPLWVEPEVRYAPDPNDTSLEAAFERANQRDIAERKRLEAERPVATLARGGKAPDFITEEGSKKVAWAGSESSGEVWAKVRKFHVLDAIEHAVSKASTEADLEAIVQRYFPLVAAFGAAIDATQGPRRSLPRDPRFLYAIYDAPVYFPDLDPGAQERLKVFEAAVARRTQQVPELAKSRLIPQTRRRGGCRLEPITPLGDDPLSTIYCHLATGSPYSYRITIESATGGLTQRWAEIDALRGNTWYECKCGYEALLADEKRGKGTATAILDKLDKQVLNHRHIADTCGLEYRYIVSSERVAQILRERWMGNVVIDVVPWQGCN